MAVAFVLSGMPKERGGTGQYVETTALDDVLGVFGEVRGPVVTSADVADALDCSRDTARRKLTELRRQGRVESRETAGRVVWWLSNSGSDGTLDSDDHRHGDDGGHRAGDDGGEDAESAPEDVNEALDALGLGTERRAAVRAMYDFLREQGTARKSDFTGEVYPDHSAGYQSAGGWWNALGKDALGELPGVRKPSEGRPQWRFDADAPD